MRFIEQAQLDFQDFAIVGDATWTFVDGVLTLTVDLPRLGAIEAGQSECTRVEAGVAAVVVPDLLVGAFGGVEPLEVRAVDRDPERLRERVRHERADAPRSARGSRAAARPGRRGR